MNGTKEKRKGQGEPSPAGCLRDIADHAQSGQSLTLIQIALMRQISDGIDATSDLLAACKRAVWWMREELKAVGENTFDNPALVECEAAISRAEGRSDA